MNGRWSCPSFLFHFTITSGLPTIGSIHTGTRLCIQITTVQAVIQCTVMDSRVIGFHAWQIMPRIKTFGSLSAALVVKFHRHRMELPLTFCIVGLAIVPTHTCGDLGMTGQWSVGRRRTEQLMPARILMFAKLSNNANPMVNAMLVAVVHPWAGASLSHDDMLFFAHGGKLDDDFLVVEATMIEGTAFVLPSIEKAGDRIPASWEEAEYFLSFPPRHTWKDIGW